VLFRSGNYEEARRDYDRGIQEAKDINKINYANFKAFTYVHSGDPKMALQQMQQLVDSADSMHLPQDQTDALKLGTLNSAIIVALHYNLIDDSQRIIDQIRKITNESNARVADAAFGRVQNANLLLLDGQLSARKKDFATAQAKADESYKMVEKDANARRFEGYYALKGLIEYLQGNNAKAVEYYKKADLTNVYVQYQLALAEDGAGQKQQAKQLFREVSHWNFNTVGFALIRKDALNRSA